MTSKDWTYELIELEDAKARMQDAVRTERLRIEREAKRRAAREIADAVEEIEYKFARKLAEANAAGIPQSLLRKEVLRTNDWPTWVKWRDKADIAPQRQVIQDKIAQRAVANLPHRFEKFTYRGTERDAILWLKDKKGKTLDTPLRAYVVWDFLDFPDLDRDQEDYRKSVGYGFEEFTRLTGAIIKEHYEGKEQGE